WRPAELTAVLTAIERLGATLTPSPVALTSLAEQFGEDFSGWQKLAGDPGRAADRDRLDPWSRDRLDQLAELERTWPGYAAGDTLVHADIRADNVLLTRDGPVILDWPHACVGAAISDLVFLAPSVSMQGGPEPAELLTMTAAGRAADHDAVTATVCALAGFFIEHSLRPHPPGIPTVREFQAAQGVVARRWLATLL
ncbi:MAG TPA: phosphotransferase, partial [Streptosporangiaceae bacterium]